MTKFERYDAMNPHVWDLFVRFTFDVIRAGHTRFSADSILHRIRWETSVVTISSHYKINNDFSADYARKFIHAFPHHNKFFEIRRRPNGNK
jgi:hypothetical protein